MQTDRGKASSLRRILFGVALLVFGISSFLGVEYLTVKSWAQSRLEVAPFVLERESFNSEGDLIGRSTIARRSNGTTAIVDTAFGAIGLRLGETGRKVTRMDGTVITLADSIAAKTTWPRMDTAALARMKKRLSDPPENCVLPGDTLIGHSRLFEVDVAIVQLPLFAGDRMTHWRAPKLACETLQSTIETVTPSGPLELKAETRLVRLELREPDFYLFDEGSSYLESEPSDRLRKGAQRLGIPWTQELQTAGERMDRVYRKAQDKP